MDLILKSFFHPFSGENPVSHNIPSGNIKSLELFHGKMCLGENSLPLDQGKPS